MLLCFLEAKILMLPESGLYRFVLVSRPQFGRVGHTCSNCWGQHVLPALLLYTCHIYAGLRAFVHGFPISPFLLFIQIPASLQDLAHIIPSWQDPIQSEASLMANSFLKLSSTKNCFNNLSILWAGFSCQRILKFYERRNHTLCFMKIYHRLEV